MDLRHLFSTTQEKIIFIFYGIATLALFFYSFTQVDLGLTVTRVPWVYSLQRAFQSIGYFNRPLSTLLYILLLVVFWLLYFLTLYLVLHKKFSLSGLKSILLIVVPILLFSYTAFSYDLFNYIFDARIVTHYHQNPYVHKALDYPGDPMLGFMHWTHRTYPYGPVWLALTIPLSFLSLQKLIIAEILFKLLASAAYVGTVYFLYQILKKKFPQQAVLGTMLFALNPLVIYECLISAHNDIVMLFFAVWALWALMSKKYTRVFLLLIISIGIKFATILLLPIFIWTLYVQWRKKTIDWGNMFVIATSLMFLGTILATLRTNFQPWYLLLFLPFASLTPKKAFIIIPSLVFSFVALLMYIPFLYTGNWNPPIPDILFWMEIFAVIFTVVLVSLSQVKFRRKNYEA